MRRKVVLLGFTATGLSALAWISLSAGDSLAQTTPTQTLCSDGQGPNSAYFCAPKMNNQPVIACATNPTSATVRDQCRQASATRFCSSLAFVRAANYSVTASGSLSEVLCTGRTAPVAQTGAPRTQAVSQPKAPSSAPALTTAPADTADYIYATGHSNLDGTVTFKPTLQVSPFGSDMTGFTTITNPVSDFESFYQSGSGAYTATRYTGTFSGDVFRGIWRENEDEQGLARVQTTCDRADGGTRVWGQFEVRFTPDRRSFVGTKTLCDRAISDANTWDKNAWKGTLTGRASTTASRASTGPAPNSSGPPAPPVAPPRPTAQSNQPRQETVADRIAREAADAAEQRAKEEARRGVNNAVDSLLKRRP